MSEIAEINKKRTKAFAKACLRLLASLDVKSKLFWHIEGQLIRSATSVSANYRAACLAQSDAAFVAKLSIVIEEVDESAMWLELLEEEVLMRENLELKNIHKEALELTAIFIAVRKKLNNRNK
jgi:four helix bundle protein